MSVTWVGHVRECVERDLHGPGFKPTVLFKPYLQALGAQHPGVLLQHLVCLAQDGDVTALNAARFFRALVYDPQRLVAENILDPFAHPGAAHRVIITLRALGVADEFEWRQWRGIGFRLQHAVGLTEQPGPYLIDEIHQCRLGTPVGAERHRLLLVLLNQCLQETRVRPLETHNSLLQVTHYQCWQPGRAKSPQQGKLLRVGVLEFIYHHAIDTARQLRQYIGPILQQRVGQGDHVGVIDQSGLGLCSGVVPQHLLTSTQQGFYVVLRVGEWAGVRHQWFGRRHHCLCFLDVVLRQVTALPAGAQLAQALPQGPVLIQLNWRLRLAQVAVVLAEVRGRGRVADTRHACKTLGKCIQQTVYCLIQCSSYLAPISDRAIAFRDPAFHLRHVTGFIGAPADGAKQRHYIQNSLTELHRCALARVKTVGVAITGQVSENLFRLLGARQSLADQNVLLVLRQQPRLWALAAIESELCNNAQPKAVNGRNVGLVQQQRIFKPLQLQQLASNAVFQFSGGGLGERYRENFLRRNFLAYHPLSQVFLDAVCLARAGPRGNDSQVGQCHDSPLSPANINRPVRGVTSRA